MSSKLTLDIVSQEKRLLSTEARQVTIPTVTGEITILPGHIPLVTKLSEGLLEYVDTQGQKEVVVIFGGFLELSVDGILSILADSVRASDIDLARVEKAQKEAEESLKDKSRDVEFALAESALRYASLQMKAAKHKVHKANNPNVS